MTDESKIQELLDKLDVTNSLLRLLVVAVIAAGVVITLAVAVF
ncbi:hypothetical protein [Dehalogenimonas alkenigignens]|jgi:hypothetical protein|uniref:Uncharacterized protein n=1 Tax=Dehalogenimonas alkenigignens TaxID=1217799 RepID=A0A0W0GKU8_9CHLR|nr:hypothetical protein [Dehalogenimonas alkenigignens]KTB49172.1 hypothetical protein DEALK_00840 [Dehalogenimonas alkenigignens]